MKRNLLAMALAALMDSRTSGDADDRPTEDDSFDFQPEFTNEPMTAPDVAVYNGFEVINSTSLDSSGSYGDGGFIILG